MAALDGLQVGSELNAWVNSTPSRATRSNVGVLSQFSGAKASISREVGGSFTAYDGALSGVILELVPDAKIVQSWRGSDDGWPPDHYSTATFSLEAIDGVLPKRTFKIKIPKSIQMSYRKIRVDM